MNAISILSTLVAVVVSMGAIDARAALGGAPMSPDATDQAVSVRMLQRSANAAARPGDGATTETRFVVRETTLGSEVVIREYLNAVGTVFGVAWQGPTKPNLVELLGSYFPQYAAGVKVSRASRGIRAPVAIDSDGLVVREGGHMGAFSGQAWLPAALPAGVTGDIIQ